MGRAADASTWTEAALLNAWTREVLLGPLKLDTKAHSFKGWGLTLH